jgi:flavorubredoxin
MPVVRQEFLETLWSLIDPQDLRWIFLTHDDGDHTGCLMEVLEAAPQARMITNFIGLARLDTAYHIPVKRVQLLNPGQRFSAGDRQLAVLRPPLFDSPATVALYDAKTGILFSADSFGAFIPDLGEDVADIPESAFAEGFHLFNRGNHPWFALVDQNKFDKVLETIRQLQPQIIASCHAPLARGQTESHLKAMAAIPAMEPLMLPDQAAFEAILAQMAGSGHPS